MSPLTLVVSLSAAAALCTGSEAEVPARFVGWEVADAAWLEQELSGWVAARERALCAGPKGLTLEANELEVVVRFEFKGQVRARTVSRASESSELFRYQVAATAEELVRSTWEAPPPPRFGVLARGAWGPAGGGSFFGGGVGLAVFLVPSLGVEVLISGSAMGANGVISSASLFTGTLSVSWLPVRLGVFRAGPRASVQAGVMNVTVDATRGVTPWVMVGGGATVGLEFRHLVVQLLGEVGAALVGPTVLEEGVPVQRVRGLSGTVGAQVGWSW